MRREYVAIELRAQAGADVGDVAAVAIDVSHRLGGIGVNFDFNEVRCYVDHQDEASNIKLFYLVAARMGWNHIGRARWVPMAILNTITAVDEKGQYLVTDPKAKYPDLVEVVPGGGTSNG